MCLEKMLSAGELLRWGSGRAHTADYEERWWPVGDGGGGGGRLAATGGDLIAAAAAAACMDKLLAPLIGQHTVAGHARRYQQGQQSVHDSTLFSSVSHVSRAI
jgi:hypothetical protein